MIFTRIWYIIPPPLVYFSSLTRLFEITVLCESVKYSSKFESQYYLLVGHTRCIERSSFCRDKIV
jgi:hypothetical protein